MPDVRATGSKFFRQQRDLKRKSGRYESYAHKGVDLLAHSRLQVTRVIPEQSIYQGVVHGEHGRYDVAWDSERKRYTCTCPSYGPCSHTWAFEAVVGARKEDL
jgi:uncharacterized Zn finger protein